MLPEGCYTHAVCDDKIFHHIMNDAQNWYFRPITIYEGDRKIRFIGYAQKSIIYITHAA